MNEENKIFETLREHCLVSCWNISEKESLVMWNIYTSNFGIAIKTNCHNLLSSIKDYDLSRVTRGKVTYDDDMPDTEYGYHVFFRKRKEFEYENEYRLLIIDELNYINVDLNQLIDEVHISPNAPKWFRNTVEKMLDNHDLSSKKVVYNEFYKVNC